MRVSGAKTRFYVLVLGHGQEHAAKVTQFSSFHHGDVKKSLFAKERDRRDRLVRLYNSKRRGFAQILIYTPT